MYKKSDARFKIHFEVFDETSGWDDDLYFVDRFLDDYLEELGEVDGEMGT